MAAIARDGEFSILDVNTSKRNVVIKINIISNYGNFNMI